MRPTLPLMCRPPLPLGRSDNDRNPTPCYHLSDSETPLELERFGVIWIDILPLLMDGTTYEPSLFDLSCAFRESCHGLRTIFYHR